ncbi:hypothetical protein [Runella sp.]|uniref:hypothetical protein n=1 Tax=Runella sp. TaxID=1960881 RepID=UPI003D0C5050
MKPIQDTYPIFEANQVLTNRHLNAVFNYLDEQERLTRANLIGIGIVCGLEAGFEANGPQIRITKGCGVTSEGYLIIQEEVLLTARKDYVLPAELDYPPFKNGNQSYPLWELFPTGEPDAVALDEAFLKGKALLLFLELKKDDLRNCSPNNCDDKGAEVTATVRPLLITLDDLAKIVAAAQGLGGGLTPADVQANLQTRLNLPDLRLPRYDVPNTAPASSEEVLEKFFDVFKKYTLAKKVSQALSAAYTAFRPLVESSYPNDPFASFLADFGFLDTAPQTVEQAIFVQNFYDLFDDLLQAYEELRWHGLELLCACCPPSGLFPRHLILGELQPETHSFTTTYRHFFQPSPAVGCCRRESGEVAQLFQRIVEMIGQFRLTPPLQNNFSTDVLAPIIVQGREPVRITPTKYGKFLLSEKAIPYYYLQTGTPPLYTLWSPEKTQRNRAKQNLSYRADEYATDDFIREPLVFDLEPSNFLRIEGHLGRNVGSVLRTLLALKIRYRLPVEIIALRTGEFDERIALDLTKEKCRFEDLEALYDALKDDFRSFLAKQMAFFYDLPVREADASDRLLASIVPVFKKYQPNVLVRSDRLGALFESQYEQQQFSDELLDFVSNSVNTAFFRIIFRIVKLDELLTNDLGDLTVQALSKQYQALEVAVKELETKREERFNQLEGSVAVLKAEEIDDRLEALLYQCRIDAFQTLFAEYKRRLIEAKKKQFLRFFLEKHPGIQHKAGVPLGGTFILVYHDDPEPVRPTRPGLDLTGIRPTTNTLAKSIERIKTQYVNDLELQNVSVLLEELIVANPDLFPTVPTQTPAQEQIAEAVSKLRDGTIIADFFLPYQCCSDCSPIQFVLPPVVEEPTNPLVFSVEKFTCADGNYTVAFKITGGTPPYKVAAETGTISTANNFKSKPVPSGTPITVEISDAEDQKLTKTFIHECPSPCNLPCGGKAIRCGYVFWLPEPSPERKLESYDAKIETFQFTAPDGSVVDLAGELDISAAVDALNADFKSMVERWLKKINAIVAQKVQSDDWFVLGYHREANDPFGVLTVEHFACQGFILKLTTKFSYRDLTEKRSITYSDKGTQIKLNDANETVDVPTFGCEEMNKCLPNRELKPVCIGTTLQLRMKTGVDQNNVVSLLARPSGTDEELQFLWEVEDAVPSLLVGKEVKTAVVRTSPRSKQVRLTAFTKTGCVVSIVQTINLPG